MNYRSEWLNACFSKTEEKTYFVVARYQGEERKIGPYSGAVAEEVAEEYRGRKCEVEIIEN